MIELKETRLAGEKASCGYGKPTSIVETHIDNRNLREWTTEELDAFLNEALRKEALEQN